MTCTELPVNDLEAGPGKATPAPEPGPPPRPARSWKAKPPPSLPWSAARPPAAATPRPSARTPWFGCPPGTWWRTTITIFGG